MAMPSNRICVCENCGKPVKARNYCNGHYARWLRYGSPLAGGTQKGAVPEWVLLNAGYDGDSCLIWPFKSVDGYGYGHFRPPIFGETKAHRAMCAMRLGPPPSPDHEAAHSCGNGHLSCVNPKHIRWALRTENQADRIVHGTSNRGSRHGLSVLTEQQVRDIRRMQTEKSQSQLAKMFGISQPLVSAIVNRKRWQWLD